MPSHFKEPVDEMLEGSPLSDIVEQQRANRVAIVRPRNGSESFLSRSVPKLELNSDVFFNFHESGKEVDAHSRIADLLKLAVRERLEQGALADGTVADEDQSELVLEDRVHHPRSIELTPQDVSTRSNGHYARRNRAVR